VMASTTYDAPPPAGEQKVECYFFDRLHTEPIHHII